MPVTVIDIIIVIICRNSVPLKVFILLPFSLNTILGDAMPIKVEKNTR